MDSSSQILLGQLIRRQRIAALGTLRQGDPQVSLVLFAPEPDFSGFWMHLSRLALHTQNLMRDPRAGLMIFQPDPGQGDPQSLARVSIQGEAKSVADPSVEFDAARGLYLAKFPEAEGNFFLGDFELYRLQPESARYVAGFGRIFNLSIKDFREASETR